MLVKFVVGGHGLGKVFTRNMLGLFTGIEMRNRAMITHDAGPHFAAGALGGD